jgi:hypothetical protein
MEKLTFPSKRLAARILSEVGFEDRLMGYRLGERTGPMSIPLYSFEEVVGLLNEPHPRIDFNRLEEWVRDSMGDVELAGKIRDLLREDISDQDRSLRIRDLMALRLHQCLESISQKV